MTTYPCQPPEFDAIERHLPELVAMPHWVVWRAEPNPDGPKPRKVPYIPGQRMARKAASDDARTWGTYARAKADVLAGLADGVGFELGGSGFYGFDFDHVVDAETGEIDMGAEAYAGRLATYTETSPSGTGLRGIGRGQLPPGGRRKRDVFGDDTDLELYDSGRYLTITGRHLEHYPDRIADANGALADLHALVFGKQADPSTRPPPATDPTPFHVSDEMLLEHARRARNGAKFAQLWAGDLSGHNGDASGADQALCNLLAFWCGPDPARIDAMFRQSGLYRDKWDVRHHSDGRTYGAGTIDRALEGRTEFYQWLAPERRTDVGNGLRLVRQHGRDLRYCEALGGWLVWDGRRWAPDLTGDAVQRAKATARQIYAEAKDEPDEDASKALGKWAIASESAQRINAMLAMASTEPAIAATPADFDADPWVLNASNGTIDLRTGEIRPHRREDMLTLYTPVAYHPDATDERFTAFLSSITRGDADLARHIRMCAGYSLTGDASEETVLLVQGRGGSGKTTLLEALRQAMGEYAHKAGFSTFLARQGGVGEGDPPRADLVRLRGMRLVYAAEPEKGRRLAASTVKEISGRDTVTARLPHARQSVSFVPVLKLWLVCNDAPVMDDDDTGLWRRLQRIPLDLGLPREQQDLSLKTHLQTAAAEAVLAWAVAGCLDWQRHGMTPPQVVLQRTAELRAAFNPIGEFLEAWCVVDPAAEVAAGVLRTAYTQWAAGMGAKPIDDREWSKRLKGLGCRSTRPSRDGVRVSLWEGIRLRGPDDADAGDDEPEPNEEDLPEAPDPPPAATPTTPNRSAGLDSLCNPTLEVIPPEPFGVVGVAGSGDEIAVYTAYCAACRSCGRDPLDVAEWRAAGRPEGGT